MTNTYDIGDQVRLTATFKNRAGTETSPTTVAFKYRAPGGVVSTAGATNDSTGVYHVDLTINAAGQWRYRWEGTGALIAAEDGRFYVSDSDLA